MKNEKLIHGILFGSIAVIAIISVGSMMKIKKQEKEIADLKEENKKTANLKETVKSVKDIVDTVVTRTK